MSSIHSSVHSSIPLETMEPPPAGAQAPASDTPESNHRESQATETLPQEHERGSQNPESSDISDGQKASKAFRSGVHVLTGGTKSSRSWTIHDQSVDELLYGTKSWLRTFCHPPTDSENPQENSQNMAQEAGQPVQDTPGDGATQDPKSIYQTCWIHLPAHNVRESRLDWRISNTPGSLCSC